MLKPYPAENMVAWQASRAANSPKNNHARLIEPHATSPATTVELPPLDLDPGEIRLE